MHLTQLTFKLLLFQAQREGRLRWGRLGSRPLVIGLRPGAAALLLELGLACAAGRRQAFNVSVRWAGIDLLEEPEEEEE